MINSARDNISPKRALSDEYLLQMAESVRAEILYKMRLVHRLSLAIVTAPVIVLPVVARTQDLVVKLAANPSGGKAYETTFSLVMLLVSVGLPLLLLWAEFFCISQINGILRAGEWLRSFEQQLNLDNPKASFCGWESWIESEGRRTKDDIFELRARFVLITLFYITAALLSSILIHKFAILNAFPLFDFSIRPYLLLPIMVYISIYLVFIRLRNIAWYQSSALSQ